MAVLRPYSDLLMQQVHRTQKFAHRGEKHSLPRIEDMNRAPPYLMPRVIHSRRHSRVVQRQPVLSLSLRCFSGPIWFLLCHLLLFKDDAFCQSPWVLRFCEEQLLYKKTQHVHPARSQQCQRTHSDTDCCDGFPLQDPDRPAHCSRNTLHGDSASAEGRFMARKKPEPKDPLPEETEVSDFLCVLLCKRCCS